MKKIFLIITGTALLFSARGQTITTALIGSGAFQSPSVDWAVGETLTQTYQEGNYLLTHGFFQGSNQTTSSDELIDNKGFYLHPNPVKSSVTINVPNKYDVGRELSLEIISVTGQSLLRQPLSSNSKTLDFSTYPSGLYFMKIIQDNTAVQIIKLIKL